MKYSIILLLLSFSWDSFLFFRERLARCPEPVPYARASNSGEFPDEGFEPRLRDFSKSLTHYLRDPNLNQQTFVLSLDRNQKLSLAFNKKFSQKEIEFSGDLSERHLINRFVSMFRTYYSPPTRCQKVDWNHLLSNWVEREKGKNTIYITVPDPKNSSHQLMVESLLYTLRALRS